MKILFLNAYFLPEKISFTHLEQDLIRALLEEGHEIEVLCPVPTRGIDRQTTQQYKNKKNEKLFDGKVTVTRFWAPQEGRNPLVRAFRYVWCNLRQYMLALKYKDVQAIFAVSTPPTQGWVAGKLAKKLGCRFVYSLQDVFPDSLVTTGLAREDSLLWKIGRKLEDSTYKAADKIIVISNAMAENIRKKGVSEQKICVVSNWIDTDVTQPVAKCDNRLYEEFGISKDKTTVVYAGNFGAAQGAEVVLKTAELLPDIQFVIFGGGTEFEQAKKMAQSLPNVIINGLLPQGRVPEVYSLGDVALITCKKGVGGSGMPSKTWSIMACNTPIVAAFDLNSELVDILERTNAGVGAEPENAEAVAQAIMQVLKGNYTGGRAYVCEHASKTACVREYVELIGRGENE